MPRRTLALGAAVAVLVAAASVPVVLWAWPDAAGEASFRGSVPPAGFTLPEFELRDHRGRALRSAELRGRVVAVTFLETKCRAACPIIAAQIREAARMLSADERRQIVFVAVSTHPGDDSPASVDEFVRRHRVGATLRYLIGSEQELRPVWEEFQVLSAVDSGTADVHSAPVRIYDESGVWVSTLHAGADLSPANLAHDLRTALG
jgi:protein SCO1